MKDVVRYERTIGELLERNEALSADLSRQQDQNHAIFLAQQENTSADLAALTNIVLRLADQQGKQFNNIYATLSQMILKDRKMDINQLAAKLNVTNHLSDTMAQILNGRVAERPQVVTIDLEQPQAFKALRGSVVYEDELARNDLTPIVLREDKQHGVHSLICPVDAVTAAGFRGVGLEVMPLTTPGLRLRIRQAGDHQNYTEIAIDLKNLTHHQLHYTDVLGRHTVHMRQLQKGWVNIVFNSSLNIHDAPVEVELIALSDPQNRSSQRRGNGKRAFALRMLRILKSTGLSLVTDEMNTAIAESKDAAKATTTHVQVEVKSPGQEQKRQEGRAAYLASGAYQNLTRFRNIHQGKRAFIIGNGPSINNQDLTLLKDEVTFATNWFINHPDYNKIDPSYFCVSSHEMFGGGGTPSPQANQDWLQQMLARAQNTHKFFSYPFRDYLLGEGIFPEDQCDFLLFDRPKYQMDQKGDINLDLTQHMDDGYTGIITFCLPLCHFMGIKEVYLIGCDCDYGLTSPEAPKSYFYDFSKHTTKTTSYEGLKRVWADDGPIFQTYEIVRQRFLLDGIQIINCTDGGRLEVFPRARYEDIVAQA